MEHRSKVRQYSVTGTVFRTGWIWSDTVTLMCDFNTNGYRLPTSDEWEYAARGGLSSKRFPWGDAISHGQANYHGSWSDAGDCFTYDLAIEEFHPSFVGADPNPWLWEVPLTSPVGSFPPNAYGLYDMSGNVAEFCWDDHYYLGNLTGKVVRGGDWRTHCPYLRCGDIDQGAFPSDSDGFRCVRQE